MILGFKDYSKKLWDWLTGSDANLRPTVGIASDANIVQLSGSIVQIGEKTYPVSNGNCLRGKASDKPDAAAAHAVIPFCYYHAIDAGTVESTDGTSWVVI